MYEDKFIHETKKTSVRLDCDVLIAGGGTAGIVAAIASARTGVDTVLIDRNGFLGGTMINGAGPLHSFFNLYTAFKDVPKVQVVRGIADEIISRLIAVDGSLGHLEQELGSDYDSVATIIDWEIFKNVIFDMMKEANVKLLLHTLIVDTITEENTIKGVIIESKSGREAILAKIVVDTSGDGDVAFHAGANYFNASDDANVGMPFGMANVDILRACKFFEENDMLFSMIHGDKGSDYDNIVRVGFNLRKLPVFKEFMDTTGMWGPLTVARHENEFSFINTTNIKSLNAIDVAEITHAEIELRKQVMKMAEMLKAHIPGFEKSYVNWTPVHFGVRRTRIIECAHDISIEEIVNAERFDDEVALYGFHDCAPRIMIKNGGYYGIPYRALLPNKIENLLVAGRLITSNWEAHMSTRNTVSCMAQGQAVGTAAALCCKLGVTPRTLDIGKLREQLKLDNVFLG